MSPRVKAHLALVIVSIIYGLNYIIAKDLMHGYIQPRGFIFMRVTGAMVLFFAFNIFSKFPIKIAKTDYWRIALCGLTGVAVNQILFFEGLHLSTPINTSIIMTVNPVLVVVLSAFFLKEIITARRMAGIVLGAAGAIYLMLNRGMETDYGTNPALGNLFVFINALSYAVYLVVVKPLMLKYNPLQIAMWVFFVGWILVLPVGVGQFMEIEWHTFTPTIYASAAFVVVATTFIAYLFNIYSLKTLSSTTVSIYIYMQPLLATLVSLGMGKEQLNWQMVLAAVLIFAGVYLVVVRK